MTDPDFDVAASHRFFSAGCFNKAWELIDRPGRTRDDDEQLLHLAHASVWHWTQRPECTSKQMTIGYWQLSRIYAILGRADEARRHAQRSLEYSSGLEPFFVGYAYEGLARAELALSNFAKASEYLAEAGRRAESVTDAEGRELLLNDLRTLAQLTGGEGSKEPRTK
jgi:tetratricopeptide (TPR) repeat protein